MEIVVDIGVSRDSLRSIVARNYLSGPQLYDSIGDFGDLLRPVAESSRKPACCVRGTAGAPWKCIGFHDANQGGSNGPGLERSITAQGIHPALNRSGD